MQLTDLIDFILDSNLELKEKEFLIKNLQNIETKFKEKFKKELDI